MNKFWFYMTIPFRPGYWGSNHPTNESVTKLVTACIKHGEFSFNDEYRTLVQLNGKQISLWTANYPYAYGSIDNLSGVYSLPDKYTRYRLYKHIQHIQQLIKDESIKNEKTQLEVFVEDATKNLD